MDARVRATQKQLLRRAVYSQTASWRHAQITTVEKDRNDKLIDILAKLSQGYPLVIVFWFLLRSHKIQSRLNLFCPKDG
ncbi:hypothetical protein ACTL6P_14045 [Endozoicomonas acroporae]|uniref:hypothetical protein n=1 Tax=Endozoicomonas acroporae TaxID=1701104 RepID=UPI0011AF8E5E|nr:hypothetical protein [Endozoicomonas acroporae]